MKFIKIASECICTHMESCHYDQTRKPMTCNCSDGACYNCGEYYESTRISHERCNICGQMKNCINTDASTDGLVVEANDDLEGTLMTLGERMFALDSQLSIEAANWNHNLAHAFKQMSKHYSRIDKYLVRFNYEDWAGKRAEAPMIELAKLDSNLVEEVKSVLITLQDKKIS